MRPASSIIIYTPNRTKAFSHIIEPMEVRREKAKKRRAEGVDGFAEALVPVIEAWLVQDRKEIYIWRHNGGSG